MHGRTPVCARRIRRRRLDIWGSDWRAVAAPPSRTRPIAGLRVACLLRDKTSESTSMTAGGTTGAAGRLVQLGRQISFDLHGGVLNTASPWAVGLKDRHDWYHSSDSIGCLAQDMSNSGLRWKRRLGTVSCPMSSYRGHSGPTDGPGILLLMLMINHIGIAGVWL
ncbi:hypothetical protein BDP81DRAFT_209967 [Colletotrichum phormii]|uniref:Uncharacterized protein n=1 Tax=Colletotrichum phormii TaxID=359342 RepID=A0AAJ0EFW5_9PEZI|nr:uncharacterized protein BDP81DRAFT_209967 [Colletotrichum phormii]KAK1637463.1 hypothetical protein BDP81DRAFT_209967 [Colletotrichum phormii]